MERSLRNVPRLTQAALEAGHEPSIRRDGGRFAVVCSCGWKTSTRLDRKATFAAITLHVEEVGRAFLGESAEVRAEVRQEVGGRA